MSFTQTSDNTDENTKLAYSTERRDLLFGSPSIHQGETHFIENLQTATPCYITDPFITFSRNFPYGYFQRLRRICDTEADFEIPPRPMTKHLPTRLMSPQSPLLWQKQPSLPVATFFQPSNKKKNNTHLHFVTRYNRQTQQIRLIVLSNWDIYRSEEEIFQAPSAFCYIKKGLLP